MNYSARPLPSRSVSGSVSPGPSHLAACLDGGARQTYREFPMHLTETEFIGALVQSKRRVRRTEVLCEAGDPFSHVYVASSGSFKSFVLTEDGRQQVTGFYIGGELMALDGIESEHHRVTITALEDGEVCVISFAHLEEMSSKTPHFQHQFHKLMSREIVREQGLMILLGVMRAHERVATFLLNLAERFRARGYSGTQFNLCMTRGEIGSYLGLSLETVSRVLSHLNDQALISVKQRCIAIPDAHALRAVIGQRAL